MQRTERGNAGTNASTYGGYQNYVSDSDKERIGHAQTSHGPSQMNRKGRKKRSSRRKIPESTTGSGGSKARARSEHSSVNSPKRSKSAGFSRGVEGRKSPKQTFSSTLEQGKPVTARKLEVVLRDLICFSESSSNSDVEPIDGGLPTSERSKNIQANKLKGKVISGKDKSSPSHSQLHVLDTSTLEHGEGPSLNTDSMQTQCEGVRHTNSQFILDEFLTTSTDQISAICEYARSHVTSTAWRNEIVARLPTPIAQPEFLNEIMAASYQVLAAKLKSHACAVSEQVSTYIQDTLTPLQVTLTEESSHLGETVFALQAAKEELGKTRSSMEVCFSNSVEREKLHENNYKQQTEYILQLQGSLNKRISYLECVIESGRSKFELCWEASKSWQSDLQTLMRHVDDEWSYAHQLQKAVLRDIISLDAKMTHWHKTYL